MTAQGDGASRGLVDDLELGECVGSGEGYSFIAQTGDAAGCVGSGNSI